MASGCLGEIMEAKKGKSGSVIKSVLVMYILTGLLLLLLAFIVSKVDQEEVVAKIGIIVIYVLVCGFGGFMLGRWKQRKKFIWGAIAGLIYVTILLGIGVVIGQGSFPELITAVTTVFVCIGAGMLGGMIS